MYSPHDTWCSHQVGSPIRISPDHRLCASPRSFSQLATSFIAFLRLGIPTHALSSLTIKLISNTDGRPKPAASGLLPVISDELPSPLTGTTTLCARSPYNIRTASALLVCICPSIFSFQRTSMLTLQWTLVRVQFFRCIPAYPGFQKLTTHHRPLSATLLALLVGLGRFELPTSSLSGMRSNQLSYRPIARQHLVELVGIEPATS
jgi:hypothetical protein